MGGIFDATSTNLTWTESKGVPEVPSPLLYRNRLYYVRNGGILVCRDPATGRTLCEKRLEVPGGYYASPVASGGRIYAASDQGMVAVLEAADDPRILARNDLAEPIMATPAILDGKLYVRTASALLAFGTE
jgi:outer membrane protein assembly factor BamB